MRGAHTEQQKVPRRGTRIVWLTVAAAVVLAAAAAARSYLRRATPSTPPPDAPTLKLIEGPNGSRVVQADEAALAAWCRQAGIPTLPSLSNLEADTAVLLYEATKSAVVGRSAEQLGRLGAVYHGNGYTERASACYEAAVQDDASAARWWHLLGLARNEMGDSAGAIEAFRQATRLAPTYAAGFGRLAQLLMDAGSATDARAAWQRYVALRPSDAIGHYGLGKLAFTDGHAAEAREQLETAIKQDPKNQQARYLLGRVLDRLGEKQAAEAHFRLAATIDKNTAPAISDPWRDEMFALSRSTAVLQEQMLGLWQEGRGEEAYRLGCQIMARRPDDFVTCRNVAILASKTGKPAEAIRYARRAVELNPRYLAGQTTLAEILRDQDHIDEALSAVERAFELEGRNGAPLLVRASIHLRVKHYADALLDLDQGLALQPEHGNGHAMRAVALLGLARPTEAMAALRRARELMPENAWVREQIAALVAQGIRDDGP